MKPWLKRTLQLSTLLAVALVTAVAVHWRDDAQETRDVKELIAKYEGLRYSNALASYISYVEISKELRAGKPGAAQCNADLTATAFHDVLKLCLVDAACSQGVMDTARKNAPELLADGPLPFRYYKSGEVCRPDAERS